MIYTNKDIAKVLDYAILKPTTTVDDIVSGAIYAAKHNLVSVCVSSANVEIATAYHKNVSAVIGFPHGNQSVMAKYSEADQAIIDGAKELDVVINYGRFLGGDKDIIQQDLLILCEMAHDNDVIIKAILETHWYTPEQIRVACEECYKSGADFVKSSTGFGPGGATPEAVRVMLDTVSGFDIGVKASGGIKTYEDAALYLDMGCTRLGAGRFTELCHG